MKNIRHVEIIIYLLKLSSTDVPFFIDCQHCQDLSLMVNWLTENEARWILIGFSTGEIGLGSSCKDHILFLVQVL